MVSASYEVIGTRVPRIDGVEKVTGRALYAADVILPGELYGRSLHSPYAHARIVSVDTTAARDLPGVHAVITGEDVRGYLFGRSIRDVPALAWDRVRYVGERVAAVAADDEDIAQQALDLIEIEYEPLDAVFDPRDAAREDAPILHPDYNAYDGVRDPIEGGPSNVYVRRAFDRGSVDAGFAEADVVVENTYRTQAHHAAYIEPQAVLVWLDEEAGRVRVWACNKVPYRVKEPLAKAFDIPPAQLVIHPTYIGGDFGAKSSPVSLPIAYHLAKATGRPIKMINEYTEELLSGQPDQSMIYRLKTGVKRDGTIVAHEVEHFANCGAYAGYKPGGAMGGANQAAGPYRIQNVKVRSYNVYTNTLPGQIFRAPGEPQAAFVIESQIDEVARAIGMDPVAFRMLNLIESGEEMPAGERLEDVRAKDALRAATEAGGYSTPKPANVGRGVALGDRSQGGGPSNASITLQPDGAVIIGTALFDQGTGAHTTLAQVVAEEVQVEFDRIRIQVWDTDAVEFDTGIAGSIQSRLASTVAFHASEAVKERLLDFIARRKDWPREHLQLRRHEVWRTDIEESVDWLEELRDADETIEARASIDESDRGHITAFAAQMAEVAVDPETGQVTVLKLVTAHDTGTVLNQIGHQGQINGGAMQGIGQALMEELIEEDGRVTNGSFGDYKIPTTRDIPELITVLLDPAPRGSGPYNVKGIGELPVIPVAAAIANAVEDAVGVRIRALPITSEKVYRELSR